MECANEFAGRPGWLGRSACWALLALCLFGGPVAVAHDLRTALDPKKDTDPNISWAQLRAIVHSVPPASDQRYIFERALLWTPGSTLRGCFMPAPAGADDTAAKTQVIAAVGELLDNTGVNLKISFGDPSTPNECKKDGTGSFPEDIRVSFHDDCCSAYVGRTAHSNALSEQNGPKISQIPSVFIAGPPPSHIIKHELIHALGFQHEHQQPNSPCQFNIDAMAAAWHWAPDVVKANVERLNANSRKYVFSDQYDPDSIMKYYFEPALLVGGTSSPCYSPENTKLSQQDWIGLRTAYPMNFDKGHHDQIISKRSSIDLANLRAPVSYKEAIQSLGSQ